MTLGQTIGIVRQSHSVKNDAGDKVSMTIGIDFTSASDNDVKSWLASNRVIAGQRPWRKLDINELNELDGKTFIAQNIGQKVKSRAEQVAQLTSAGIPEALANVAIDNPEKFNAIMASLDIEV